MRVLHLSSEKSWRGGEQQIAYLILESARLGIESFVAARQNSAFEKWCMEKKIPYTPMGFINDFDFISAIRLKKYCRENAPDVIHAHSSRSHGVAVLAAALGNKIPVVVSRRVDFPLKKNAFSRWKYNHPSVKKVICVSAKIREIVRETITSADKCITIYDGIDLERFAGKGIKGFLRKELGIREDEKLIGNIAAIAPHKDYFTFLDTVKILSEKINARFVITGDGPLKDQVAGRIAELGLQKKVFLLGFRDDLENVFADLDILLYTSKEEGLGSTLLDAMAYGLPIVCTDAGGVPEIVKNEINGLTSPVGDSNALAANVIRLAENPGVRESLIRTAKGMVLNYTKEIMTRRTVDVYEEVAGL